MKYLKDYDFELQYYLEKANIVVDALSRKQIPKFALMVKEWELIEKLQDMNLGLQLNQNHILCSHLVIMSEIL